MQCFKGGNSLCLSLFCVFPVDDAGTRDYRLERVLHITMEELYTVS